MFRALDTLEGVHVALKIPHKGLVTKESLDDFSREVRLAAKLDHPNILRLKSADFIDGHLVIALPLGEESLEERLARRLSLRSALDLGEQLLRAVAFAHEQHVIHCDVKPDNLLLFPDGRLRLTDFGISKIAHRTISASGAGTVGYMAPEQAMGRPSRRSDVFATGLVLWQMFSGRLPEWPFEWPLAGYARLRLLLHPDMIALLKRSLEMKPSRRFEDGGQMLAAYLRAKPKVLRHYTRTRRPKKVEAHHEARLEGNPPAAISAAIRPAVGNASEVRPVRRAGFRIHAGLPLVRRRSQGPPRRNVVPRLLPALQSRHEARLGATAPGATARVSTTYPSAQYTDRRYVGRCRNAKCDRKDLMPFMRYCPWCHTKVRQAWKIAGSKDTCRKCGWGVLRDFWTHCPWCAAAL